MKNNKGFAISLMLYAMILLIVTIFYIVLAIVKTRFTYSESMVNSAIEFLDKHDESMGHKDRTGPLVVFDPPASGFSATTRITIEIYDDNDGNGLNLDSIYIGGGPNTQNGPTNTYYRKGYQANNIKVANTSVNTKAHFEVEISDDVTLYVSAMDNNGNYSQTLPRSTKLEFQDGKPIYRTYSYQRYIVGSTGPSCELQDPKLISYTSSGTPGSPNYRIHISGYNTIANKKINSGDMIAYELVCRGENGIDAYLNVNDFKHTAKTIQEDNKQNKYIYVNSISVVNGINETRVIILATGLYIPNGTGDAECTEPLAIELKENYNIRDSAGNMAIIGDNQKLNFNDHKVRVCMSVGGGTNPGGNDPGNNPGDNPDNPGGSNPPSLSGITVTGVTSCDKYFYGFTFVCGDSRPIYNARYGYTSKESAQNVGNASISTMIDSCSETYTVSPLSVTQDWGYSAVSNDGTVNHTQPHIATYNQATTYCKEQLNGKSGTCRITCG